MSTKVVMGFDYDRLKRVQNSHPRATGSILRFQRAKRISWLNFESWVFSDEDKCWGWQPLDVRYLVFILM